MIRTKKRESSPRRWQLYGRKANTGGGGRGGNLMAGVIASHAKNAEDASELLEGFQRLTQRFLTVWIDDEKRDLLN